MQLSPAQLKPILSKRLSPLYALRRRALLVARSGRRHPHRGPRPRGLMNASVFGAGPGFRWEQLAQAIAICRCSAATS